MDVTQTIKVKLDEIQEREHVKILYCAESGSRAWGFASPDSDYDVRFIYVRSPEWYYKLEKTRDVIEWQLDDVLDINGWDLQKTLRLLHSSNPTLFEWNSSPIVYKTTPEWQEIAKVINKFFVAKSGLYHYLSTAKKNYREFLTGETVKFKKYFYVLRPLLACRWILDKGTPPPMEFGVLANGYLDRRIKPRVDGLVYQKIHSPEIAEGERIDLLNEYIISELTLLDEALKEVKTESRCDWGELNEMFLRCLACFNKQKL